MHIGPMSQRRAHARTPVSADSRSSSADSSTHVGRHLWKAVLALGPLLIGAYYLLPVPVGADLVYGGIGLGATIAIVVGMRVHQVADPTGWYPVAAANIRFVSGDAVFDI